MSAALVQTHSIRAAAVMLALAVLIGGMPLSIPTVTRSREVTFTLDICHPVQTWTFSPVSAMTVFPGTPAVTPPFVETHKLAIPLPLKTRAADAPDPPPPKTLG